MNAPVKKSPPAPISAYKIAAATRRAKVASMITPVSGEVKPSQGRIRVTLNGKAISRQRHVALFGLSSIDIPEYALYRKHKPD